MDLLPIVGLSAASAFLTAYKTPLFVVSIGINLFGLAVMARQLRRAHRLCDVVSAAGDGESPGLAAGVP